MPYYDYECKDGHVFEELCSYKEREISKDCPDCGTKGQVIMTINSDIRPSFGYESTQWNQRERKRISETKNGTYKDKFSGHI